MESFKEDDISCSKAFFVRRLMTVFGFMIVTSIFVLSTEGNFWTKDESNVLLPVDYDIVTELEDPSITTTSTVPHPKLQLVLISIGSTPKNNPYGLNEDEIRHQFASAKVASLRQRVKRFACWHSCFGPFRKKVMRRQHSKPTTAKPKSTSDTSVAAEEPKGPQGRSMSAKRPKNNDLGDGEEEEDLIDDPVGEQPPRMKKEAKALDYFKLKTRVVRNKDSIKSSTESTNFSPTDGTSTTMRSTATITSTSSKPSSEIKSNSPEKKTGSTFGSYVKKKRTKPPASPSTTPRQVVVVKSQVQSESVEESGEEVKTKDEEDEYASEDSYEGSEEGYEDKKGKNEHTGETDDASESAGDYSAEVEK